MNLRSCSLLLCSLMLLNAESAAGLKWTPPAGWKIEGARPMRAATYTVEDAECAVYFFGPGQGGGIDDNLQRWKKQFHGPDAKTGKRTIHSLAVTTIDVSGEYSGMGGGAAKPAYRMLGAIVEGPGGNVFFKFTGPAKMVAANQVKFDQLINSVSK